MKKIAFFILLIITVFSISACNKKQIVNTPETGRASSFRRPDFGQPEEAPDIRGLVSSVTGNEVTILKIDRPQFDKENNKESNDKEKTDEENKTSFGAGASGGRMPGMGRGMGGRQNMDEDMQKQMFERMKEMASGEEKVLIPVGIQMLKPEADGDSRQPNMVEASLEDVKKDIMLQVWLDKNIVDRKVANFVLIMR